MSAKKDPLEAAIAWAMATDTRGYLDRAVLTDWPEDDMTAKERRALARLKDLATQAEKVAGDLSMLLGARARAAGVRNPDFIQARNRMAR